MADNMKIIPQDKSLEESLHKAVRSDGDVSRSAMSSTHSSNIMSKLMELKQALARSKLGCDIKWSIFVCACQSYRVSSCLHPFPPMFVKNGQKDISSVLECIDQMPLLSSVLHSQHPGSQPPDKLHSLIHLLHWLLHEQSPSLQEVPRTEYNSVLDLVSSHSNLAKPDFIFQNTLFGQGIYLAAELGVCLIFSPYSAGWSGSCVGSELSVVALCSIVDDPEQVKCQEDSDEKKRRCVAENSVGGEVPNKYYVVENSDLVKIKYLLVYSRHRVSSASSQRLNRRRQVLLAWLASHKFLLLLLGYSTLLLFIGLSGNVTFQRYCRTCLTRVYELLVGSNHK